MIVNTILFLIVILLLLYKYETGVMFIAITSVWLTMWRTPLTGSIYVIPAILAIVLGLIKYGYKIVNNYPFRYLIIFPFISIIVTNIFTGFDLYPILELIVEYIFPIILFNVLKDYLALQKFMKILTVFLILVLLYATYEEITVSNPLIDWCVRNRKDFYFVSNKIEMRFGFKRAQSFLLYCSGLGALCNYSFFILAYLRSFKSKLVDNRKYTILLFALPIFSFLTGTRSVFIPFMIICLAFINVDYVKRHFLKIAAILLISYFTITPIFKSIYYSIIQSDEVEDVRGSSGNMREVQFEISKRYMNRSPIVGNGTHYTAKVKEEDSQIFGAESIWFPLMIEQGLLGCVCLGIVFVGMVIYLLKNRYYKLLFYMLSFIVGKTISAMSGIGEGFYFVIFVFLLRCQEFGALTNNKENCEYIQNT